MRLMKQGTAGTTAAASARMKPPDHLQRLCVPSSMQRRLKAIAFVGTLSGVRLFGNTELGSTISPTN